MAELRELKGSVDDEFKELLDELRELVDSGSVIRMAAVVLVDAGDGLAASHVLQRNCDRDQWSGLLLRGAWHALTGADVEEGD